MRWQLLCASVLVLSSLVRTLPAFAGDLTTDYDRCIRASDSNAGWAKCSTDEINRQEHLLSAAWNTGFALMKKVSNHSAQSLLQEQRSWVKFKDTACSYYSSGDFGREGQALGYGECKASVIAQRAKALTALAADLKERTSE